MLVTETAWGKRIKTDVLILGTGASGVGAALRAAELKADVLMVGNNTVEDLGIRSLGADAFLVTDHLLDPTDGFDLGGAKHGTIEEFAAWAEALPACTSPATGIEAGLVDAAARERVLADNLTAGASVDAPGAGFTINGIEG